MYTLCVDASHLGSDIDFIYFAWVLWLSLTQGHGASAGFCSHGADLHKLPGQSSAQHFAEVQGDVRSYFAVRVIQTVSAS